MSLEEEEWDGMMVSAVPVLKCLCVYSFLFIAGKVWSGSVLELWKEIHNREQVFVACPLALLESSSLYIAIW